MTELITYQVIMDTFNIPANMVKGLLQRDPKIERIDRLKTGQAVYPADTLEQIAARLLVYKPTKYESPKVPDIIKQLGAAGAMELNRKKEAERLQAAHARRDGSNFPPPPAGTCRHPGCKRPATVGQYCAHPAHYSTNSRRAWEH